MEINSIEKENSMEINKLSINQEVQKNFLETALGKTINCAVDIGIRSILPDFLEDQVISLKDNLLNYGLKDGISKTVNDAIDLGKSAIGIFTGNFESISQMQNAVQKGGIIDGMSALLDAVVNKVENEGLINSSIANAITQGKNIILNNVENNIEKMFREQNQALEYTDKYINNWKECFKNKDFNGMEKEYLKIQKSVNKLIPIENTIKQARNIDILHNLIKNNGQNFNLTKEQFELAEKIC